MAHSIQMEISPLVIDWLLEIIPDHTNEHYQKIIAWKNNKTKPTWGAIKIISQKFHIPIGYFLLKTPPKEKFEVLEYRTLHSDKPSQQNSRELIDTLRYMEQIRAWMREFRIDEGMLPLNFVGDGKQLNISVTNQTLIEESAARISLLLNLSSSWLQTAKTPNTAFALLRNKLSDLGILVFMNGTALDNTHRPLNLKEFRAFTLIDDYAPLIFINARDKGFGRVFSLLHEAVHIWLGTHSLFTDNQAIPSDQKIEQFCNAVTAEIILPKATFIQTWEKEPTLNASQKINHIANILRCSELVVARRALDQHYISKKDYTTIAETLAKIYAAKETKAKGGDYHITAFSRRNKQFLLSLDYSTKSGKLSYTEAYRLANLTRANFHTLLEKKLNKG